MSSSVTTAALLCMLALACSLPAMAQSGNEGSIEGIVIDGSGAVVAGASVKLRQYERAAEFVNITDASGIFRFPILPLGTYELSVEHTGFDLLVEKNLEVTVGARINLALALRVSTHSESVVVSGAPPMLETTRSQVSATIASREISNLPVNGRSFIDFVLLTPGVNRDARAGVSFAGQRARPSLLVDGVDNNNTFFGGALGLPGTARPYQFSEEAVQEFQVNANGYSAEFGRADAGVINVVTKSGTNAFHGTAFWYYRDRSMNATDLTNKLDGQPKSPDHAHQFGAAVGGPIIKNKVFFFGNYDGQRRTAPNLVLLNLPVGFGPSPDLRVAGFQQRALDYLTARAASWVRTFNQNVFLAKMDWNVGPSHRLTATWNHEQFTGGNLEQNGMQNSFEHTGASVEKNDTLSLSLTSTLTPSLVNVARFGYVRSDEQGSANGVNPEANVFEAGQLVLTVGRSPNSPREISINGGEWSDTLSYSRGHHLVKTGVDFLLDRIMFFTASSFSGSYRFSTLESFGRSLAGAPSPLPDEFFRQAFSGSASPGISVHPNFLEFAGFLQDEWRLRPSLTLNLGLRYDLQVIAKPSVKNPSLALAAAGLDTSFLRTDKTEFAPRVGFAWTPLRSNRLVIRGNYGIFYARTPSIIPSRADFQNGLSVQTRTFDGGKPSANLIPAYPNTICGAPDPSGIPPSCAAPVAGVSSPILNVFSPGYTHPYTQQASLGIEYQLQRDLTASVGYLGVKGTRLYRTRDVNLAIPETPTQIGIAGTSKVLAYGEFTLPRPIAGFDRIWMFGSDANSIYHALVVALNRRFSRNFQFLGAYTLSKVIDDLPDANAVTPGPDDSRVLYDPTNPRADRAAGANDQRHRFVLSGIWDLNYAHQLPKTAKAILGGWEVSGILTVQTGQPYSGLVNFDLNNDGNSSNEKTPGLGRDTFYLPATVSFDPRVTRNMKLTEHAKLQFIWEAFNVFNRPNVTGVRTTQFSHSTLPAICGIAGAPCLVPQNNGLSAFGTPTATSGPRIMQLSAKFVF
jgi:hypothetical protein